MGERVTVKTQEKEPIILREFITGEAVTVTKAGDIAPGTVIIEESLGSDTWIPLNAAITTIGGERVAITKNDEPVDGTGGVVLVRTRSCTYNASKIVVGTSADITEAIGILETFGHYAEDYNTRL